MRGRSLGDELVKVSCASLRRERRAAALERGPAGPSTSHVPSSALPVHEDETEMASPAARTSCSGGSGAWLPGHRRLPILEWQRECLAPARLWGQAASFGASYLPFSGSDERCLWRDAALAAKTLQTNWGCDTPSPPPPKSPWSRAAGSGDPRFAPSPAAGCECAHKSSAVLIPLRLWFFFLFPLPYTSLWGSGVTLPVAGALPWLC